jgi:hypothetical protein
MMADNPLIWDVNEIIPIRLFLMDPNTGLGLTGQVTYIVLTIQRLSDNLYWNETNWDIARTVLHFAEIDSVNSQGLYVYNLPAIANYQADKYEVHASINNPPLIQGDSYEIHVSRSTSVRVYESEPA